MSTQELHTLVNLLDDPDTVVYDAVASRFLEQGNYSIPFLEQVWTQTIDVKKRVRIENLIQQIHTNDVMHGLQQWIDGPHRNLLEGAYWLAKEHYPKLQLQELERLVDDITKDIWVALADEKLPPLNRINVFNNFFYRLHKFGASDEPLNPTYCCINRVLETKSGNDASLGLLYLHIAQQIGLPIYGVCLPGLFLLAYINSFGDILCYINPINKGLWSDRKALTDYLVKKQQVEPLEQYYQPCSNTMSLLRLIEFTIYAYEQENNTSQAAIYRSFASLFAGKTSHLLGEEPL